MAILTYLCVATGRAIRSLLLAVFARGYAFRHVVFVALAVTLIVALIVFAVKRNRFELELLAGGTCESVQESFYTPPPTQTCSARNSDGDCTAWQTHYHQPYLRTLVRCEGHKDFWRRSTSIPEGSFQ